ncbi:hypothetical protein D9599_28535 [Roseomonas sp. KE2513]|uniref:hypothetical protein n=1 Tax=Roseomonas sp. KE2513 TaxID=2479202 RepID=UPI0018DF6F7E|nr:hypothetical protein [Roseomonas sp. KE2513]MBI0539468.1 hypothetical protein [Roseomonas sp. KE2513]
MYDLEYIFPNLAPKRSQPGSSSGSMIGTAGLMVLFMVGLSRHTMALGGSGWADVLFAVTRCNGLTYQGSASTLALIPAG